MVTKLILGVMGVMIGALLVGIAVGLNALQPLMLWFFLLVTLLILRLINRAASPQGQQEVVFAFVGLLIGAITAILGILPASAIADGAQWIFLALLILIMAM